MLHGPLGTTNNAYFLGFPPWTLLFSGIEGHRYCCPTARVCWDLNFKFLFNPNGHNLFWRATTGRWEVIVSNIASTDTWYMSELGQYVKQNAPMHKYLYVPADFAPFLLYA